MDEYDIGKAFEAIEKELIASMIRNMDRHKAEENDMGIEWSQWQVEQLKALEKFKRDNQKKYSEKFKDINRSIDTIIRTARDAGGMEQEVEILESIKNGFKGYKKASDAMTAQFFRMNDRKIDALIKATTDDIKKAETAILRMSNDKYRQIIFNAQVYANTGAATYEKAVDMATKDMLAAGINCVEYKNGARHTLKDYADMAIRTASKRAYLTGEGEKRQEWGISTVIMNKRGNPCPKCLPWVGKILIDDVWSGGKSTDGSYPLMSTAIAAGLYHPRCKDSHTTYFEGISTHPDDRFTDKEISDIGRESRKESKLQYIKKQQEKYERLSDNSLDQENKKMYGARAKEYFKEQEWFSYKNEPVFYDPKNDYSISIDGYSGKVNDGISKAAEDVAKKGSVDGYEHMHLIDLSSGDSVHYETNGQKDAVGYDFWKVVKKNPDKQFAYVHNHNIISSLSETDLETVITTDNIPIMIAVQNDGVKYIAIRTKDAIKGYYPDIYYETELEMLNIASRNGKISASDRIIQREKIIIESITKEFFEKGIIRVDGKRK